MGKLSYPVFEAVMRYVYFPQKCLAHVQDLYEMIARGRARSDVARSAATSALSSASRPGWQIHPMASTSTGWTLRSALKLPEPARSTGRAGCAAC